MRRVLSVAITLFLLWTSALAQQTENASKIPYGWTDVGGKDVTLAKSVTCAPGKRCSLVIGAWSGAALDRADRKLILFGGGHADYYGNEEYALSYAATKPSFTVLYKATEPDNSQCANLRATIDGHSSEEACTMGLPALRTVHGACYENPSAVAPNSRHTYAGLAGVPALSSGHPGFFVIGGAFSCASGSGDQSDAWLQDLTTGEWKHLSVPRPWSGSLGSVIAQHDSKRNVIYLASDNVFGAFDPVRSSFKLLNGEVGGGIYAFGALDPVSDEFVLFEPHAGISRIWAFDLKQGRKRDLTSKATGCSALIEPKQDDSVKPYGSGISFDPGDQSLVIWPNAGSSVVVFKNGQCSTENYSGAAPSTTGPDGRLTGSTNGTYGRWQNVGPGLFLLVNDWNLPAKFLCRKKEGCEISDH